MYKSAEIKLFGRVIHLNLTVRFGWWVEKSSPGPSVVPESSVRKNSRRAERRPYRHLPGPSLYWYCTRLSCGKKLNKTELALYGGLCRKCYRYGTLVVPPLKIDLPVGESVASLFSDRDGMPVLSPVNREVLK